MGRPTISERWWDPWRRHRLFPGHFCAASLATATLTAAAAAAASQPGRPTAAAAARGYAAQISVAIQASDLTEISADALKASVQNRVLSALPVEERSAAAFVPTVLADSTLTVSVTGDVMDASFTEQVRQLAHDALCTNHGDTCSVTVDYTTPTARRRLQASTAGDIVFSIQRDIFSTGGLEVSSSSSEGTYSYVEVEFGGGEGRGKGGESLEPVSAFLTAKGSVLDTANPVVNSFGTSLIAELPSSLGASVVGSPTLNNIKLLGDLVTLGSDTNDLNSKRNKIRKEVASDIGLDRSKLSVPGIAVYHPPMPPPAPPPSPYPPPAPPSVPPTSPSLPPLDWWYQMYYENEGCDPECVGGCRRSRWTARRSSSSPSRTTSPTGPAGTSGRPRFASPPTSTRTTC